MSVFEFIDDLDSACEAMDRVMRPNGRAFITATGDSPVFDLGLKLMTVESADDDFADRRARVEAAIREHFVIDSIVGFPRFSVLGIQVYRAFGLRVRRSRQRRTTVDRGSLLSTLAELGLDLGSGEGAGAPRREGACA